MGVVSNKINIMELMKSGGGGDPTLPGRVSTLENEMSGVYASINQISTVELPKVYSSISAVSNLILDPVTGLEARIEKLEDSTQSKYYKISVPGDGTTKAGVLANTLLSNLETFYNNMVDGDIMLIDRLLIAAHGNLTCPYNPRKKGTDSFRNPVGFGSINTSASSLTMRGASLWKGTTGTSVFEGVVIDLNNMSMTKSTSTFDTIIPTASQELAIYFYVINSVKTPS